MSPDFTPVSALAGGALIGLAATLLMYALGRIAGISGIVGAVLRGELGWQRWFLLGLVAGAGLWLWLAPSAPAPRTGFPPAVLVVAGLLVGYGTRLGSGCTSGHGVCG
ncbi:MAG: YeeE/YedE family protein, partial [Pseudomonadales bacterium]|nr:YeeE/YedE family protein [Pseudomonadales bacterium]